MRACDGVRRPLRCRGGRQWAAVAAALNGRSAERRANPVAVPNALGVAIAVAGPIAEALAVGAHKPLAWSVVRVQAAMSTVASRTEMTLEQALVRMVLAG